MADGSKIPFNSLPFPLENNVALSPAVAGYSKLGYGNQFVTRVAGATAGQWYNFIVDEGTQVARLRAYLRMPNSKATQPILSPVLFGHLTGTSSGVMSVNGASNAGGYILTTATGGAGAGPKYWTLMANPTTGLLDVSLTFTAGAVQFVFACPFGWMTPTVTIAA